MSITQHEFFKKYRDEFDDFRGLRDLIDTMLEMSMDESKEEAYENLREWFITDDLEIISDYLTLIDDYLSKDTMEYIRSEFGIEEKNNNEISQDEFEIEK